MSKDLALYTWNDTDAAREIPKMNEPTFENQINSDEILKENLMNLGKNEVDY